MDFTNQPVILFAGNGKVLLVGNHLLQIVSGAFAVHFEHTQILQDEVGISQPVKLLQILHAQLADCQMFGDKVHGSPS